MAYNKNIKGIVGEVFARNYCKENYIPFETTSEQEDKCDGIDCYVNHIPTDIKNTDSIYFLLIDFHGNFTVRHPFKNSSKATHYFFVDVNNKGDGKFKEFVLIEKYLLKHYFNSKKDLITFMEIIQSIDNKPYTEKGNSLDQASFTIKKELLPLLKDNICISYDINEKDLQLASFKLFKQEKVEEKPIKKKIQKTKKALREVIEINL